MGEVAFPRNGNDCSEPPSCLLQPYLSVNCSGHTAFSKRQSSLGASHNLAQKESVMGLALQDPWESRESKPLLGLTGCLRSNGVTWPQLRSEVLLALNPALSNNISKDCNVG